MKLGTAIVLAGVLALAGSEVLAQRLAVPVGRPVRLEGYWNRSRADAGIIGDLTISADGRDKRAFGVTAAQAYQPPEEGVQIFRASSLSPVTLILRGREEMVRRFLDAGPQDKIVALGVYVPGPAQLVLNSVEIVASPPS
jgi:hypothetical protein